MKLKNIFKKGNKNVSKTNVKTLDKKQLEKVIGGADTEKVVTINTSHVEYCN